MEWIRVAACVDCPVGTMKEYVVGDRIVALANVEGTFYALDGICPHQGGPLGRGCLQGPIVTCPWHGWQFDVTSGRHRINPTFTHPTYPVRIADGDVYVGVS